MGTALRAAAPGRYNTGMPRRHELARLLCVGFAGTKPTPDLLRLLDRGLGGVILFQRNIESAGQLATLTADLKRRAGRPLLIAIDHEGGRVVRAPDVFTPLPPMRRLGQADSADLAAAVGRIMAAELRAVNIDLNFAPVLDVDTNPANPVIGDRSFGPDPAAVGRLGAALLRAMQAGGVAACGKHFPGHGDTAQDSHLELPRLPHDLERLEDVELPPFRAAIAAGVASIMTAHVLFPALDARRPSTMSQAVLDGLLRQRLGFDGVVVSDDLEMKAIAANYALEEAVVHTIAAGADLLLVCQSPEAQNHALEAAEAALSRGHLHPDRISQALGRLDRLVAGFVHPPVPPGRLELLRCAEHRRAVAGVQ
jgi:beta-N-acetylhexosaminidase